MEKSRRYSKSSATAAAAAAAANSSSSRIAGVLNDSKIEQQQLQLRSSFYSRYDHRATTSSIFEGSANDPFPSLSSSNQSTTAATPTLQFTPSPSNNSNNDDGNNYNHYPVDATYSNADDERRSISMTIFFLVFMVLYIGFCFYYQRKRVRTRVMMDDENGNNSGVEGGGLSRREQLRENQVRLSLQRSFWDIVDV
jgi:hypothetical protein